MERISKDVIDIYISDLIKYYKDKGLTIIGLNDSQGVNTTSTFFKKGLLEYLVHALTSEELRPDVINAFSLTMNKTEHIDYFFKNNLSLEEIKLSQIYSAVSALEKVMTDVGLPKSLGKIGNAYKLIYAPKKGDENINIATTLKQSYEPVVVYSSGVNDLMREVAANPFSIKKSYKQRDKKPNYYYTLDKVNNPYTLKKVMGAIEKNFNTILGINNQTGIYTLGAYIPKSLQCEEMNIFRDLIIAYNEELKKICDQYGAMFIDTQRIGSKCNNSENNFHISTSGHNALANCILISMYQNIIKEKDQSKVENITPCEITSEGVEGILLDLYYNYEKCLNIASRSTGYERKRQLDIAAEHEREKEVFQKVLTHKTN